MVSSMWQSKFPKTIRPSYEELLLFLPEKVRLLFLRFDHEMNSVYQIYNKWQRYKNSSGWVYGYCRNYRCELFYVSIYDYCFRVFDIDVTDEELLNQAYQKVKDAYDNGYEERYASLVAQKKSDQIKRTNVRLAREKEQLDKAREGINPDRFNRFKWTPKVPRAKLVRLYKGEAMGLLDEELLDDIGYTQSNN